MNIKQPVVSIVLPTYNRAELLKKSIKSIVRQSFTDWELLVIDNESTDNTCDYMSEFSAADIRIKYFNIEKSVVPGISTYLNFGIEKSCGKYIARMDDDDEWCYKDKLKQQVEFLDLNPDYVIVGGGTIMVDKDGKELYRYFKKETDEEIRKHALLACPLDHPTVMFRKDAALSVGCYKNYEMAEDWDFFLNLGKIGKLFNFREYFLYYRQTSSCISLKHKGKYQTILSRNELKIIKDYKEYYPNFCLGYLINYIQFIYSFLPNIIKLRLQFFLRFLKRNI